MTGRFSNVIASGAKQSSLTKDSSSFLVCFVAALLAMTMSITSPVHATPVTNGLQLWLDASNGTSITADGNGKVSQWNDLSGNVNHATQGTYSNQAKTGVNTLNSKNVIFFDVDEEYFSFTDIADIRTVFWVMRDDNTGSVDNLLLGHSSTDHFRRDTQQFFDNASSNVKNGKLRLNSVAKSPTLDNVPVNEPFYLSLVTTANVEANRLIKRTTSTNRGWHGDIAEILIYNKALSNGEVIDVEDYLAAKWGFVSNSFAIEEKFPPDNGALLNQANKLKLRLSRAVDTQSANLDVFYANGSLFESIDMSNVSVTGNGTQFLEINLSSQLNKNNSYYVRIHPNAIDDLSSNSFAGITDNGTWNFTVPNNPMPVDNGLQLWLDAADNGLIISDVNGRVSKVFDKSLHFNHPIQDTYANRPQTGINSLNSKNVIFYDVDEEYLEFEDITDIRTVFWVMKDDNTGSNDNLLLGHTYTDNFRRDTQQFFDNASSNVRNGQMRLNSVAKSPTLDNVPVNEPFYLSLVTTANVEANRLVKRTTSTNRGWHGDIAELLIFNKALSNGEVIQVEDYLATKWGFVSNGFAIEEKFPPDNGAFLNQTDKLKLKFSRSVDTQSANLDIFYANGSLFESIDMTSINVTGNGTKLLEINLSSQLNKNNSYYVRIDPSAVDDLSSNSFTGITDNGTWNFTVPNNPMPVDNGIQLWFDAADNGLIISDVNGRVSKVFDKTMNFNHLEQSTYANQPQTGVNSLNSRNVIFYDMDEEYLQFEDITDIRTVFWVMKDDNTGGNDNLLLGHTHSDNFRRDTQQFFDNASSNVRNGKMKLNSETKSPTLDNVPVNEPFYLSLVTTANVEANRLVKRTTSTNRGWHGDIAELLIFDKALSNGEVIQVEDYLAIKWGFVSSSFDIEDKFPPDNGAFLNQTDKLKLKFSRSVDTQSANLDIFYANGSLFESIDMSGVSVTGNGTRLLEVNLSSQLNKNNSYYVRIDPNAVDDLSANSFAGITNNGSWSFTVPNNPMPVDNGIQLWFDAADNGLIISDVNGRVSKVFDKTMNFNHLTQSTYANQPQTGVNSLNSKNVIFFDVDEEYLQFEDITDIRTVFWVMKDDNTGGNDNLLLGHTHSDNFRRDTQQFFDNASSNVRNGKMKLNSETKSPTLDNVPVNEPFYLSLVTTANVEANRLVKRTTSTNRGWHGDIAELLIFDKALSNGEVIQVEDYLAIKWGFVSSSFDIEDKFPPDNGAFLNQTDKLKLKFSRSVDTQSANLDIFYANGSLFESIDMSGVSVTGNGTRLLEVNLSSQLNKNNSYYVRIDPNAVDDLSANSFAGITNNGSWSFTVPNNPMPVDNGIQLWFDAADNGLIISDVNGRVSKVFDKTMNFNHLTQSTYANQPQTGVNSLNSKNVIFFDVDEEYLQFEDITDIRTVFWVMKDDNTGGNDNLLLGHTHSDNFRRDTQQFFDNATSNIKNGKMKLNSETKSPALDNVPVDEPFYLSLVTTANVEANRLVKRTTSTNRSWHGDIAELIIFDKALSNGEVIQVEDYLAAKWGFVSSSFALEDKFPPDNGAFLNQTDKLKLKFSRSVDTQSANLDIFYAGGSLFESIDMASASVTGNGTRLLEVNLSSQLNKNSSYYVRIDPNAVDDLSGNSFTGITDNGSWSFTVPSNALNVDNGLSLWFDAADNGLIISDVNGRVSKVFDKTVNFNHLTQSTYANQPQTGVNSLNSKNVIFFDVDEEYLNFNDITDIRTVFWVMKDDATGGTDNLLLGHTHSDNFRRDNDEFFDNASTNIRNGEMRLNSVIKHPQYEDAPVNEAFYLSVISTANVEANRLVKRLTSTNRSWHGDIAEVLIYDKALSNGEIYQVENYLGEKWGRKLSYSFSPTDNGSAIKLTDNLAISFAENINVLNGSLSIYLSNGTHLETIDLASAQVTGNGTTTITINPTNPLPDDESFYVNITGGSFTDIANGNLGFPGFLDGSSWNFITPRSGGGVFDWNLF